MDRFQGQDEKSPKGELMKQKSLVIWAISAIALWSSSTQAITTGAAPPGEAGQVATRIIQYNFPECKRVKNATRMPDGSIKARCEKTEYWVFTVFNPKEGKTIEVALNCTAAKKLNVSC
jgi:hypothetical protein